MKNMREIQILSMLQSGPQTVESIAKVLYPKGRGCGRMKKQRLYALIYHLRKKGHNIVFKDGKYCLKFYQ
ncbi:hypothetical protein SAMN02745133_00753 [Desulforamulus putei DSM 12395]|uniref:Uncharacterized protein n=1 Tax=Desulforamulus putei DSM 12395 TaxID=1121429 RepID=A0A1M4UTA7_9FIRM|nr:hypothetical protein [Desulforamulus putei]SHE59830.1 hypothetical protein SAMN02745133_00753 [Desulforamulus putei DSM 12395]